MYTPDAPQGADVNFVPGANVYPGFGGGSLATLGSASSPDGYGISGDVPDTSGANPDPNEGRAVTTPMVGGTGGLTWWVGIGIIVGLMIYAAKKTGNASDFGNLRASTYNVAFVTLVAILGITAMKIIAVKVKNVPLLSGFSQVVIAA